MFGRHPRLAVDAFLGIEPDQSFKAKDLRSYTTSLRKRLDYAYKVATKEARRQSRRHKRRYDQKVRNVQIEPGDRVLIRNVGLKGKSKLANRWCKDIYIVVEQPNLDVPVFKVRKEHGRGIKTLHRNLLLLIMGLPLRKVEQEDSVAQPSVEDELDQTVDPSLEPSNSGALTSPDSAPLADPPLPASELFSERDTESSVSPDPLLTNEQVPDNTEPDIGVDPSRESTEDPPLEPNHSPEAKATLNQDLVLAPDDTPSPVSKTDSPSGKYVIPAKRQGPLNPLAEPYVPRAKREKKPPRRLDPNDWVVDFRISGERW